MRQVKLDDATIVSAEALQAGKFAPTDHAVNAQLAAQYRRLPAFCRVVARLHPSGDSDIRLEAWMPAAQWNRKLQAQGNGGFAGSVPYSLLAAALTRGYAAIATDTGHQAEGTDAGWAMGHPEKITDFGYRAVHEMTVQGKALVQAFYGSAADHAYFVGCSNGGRQALMEAQRFPDDYDGILAGAPANNWTRMLSAGAEAQRTLQRDGVSLLPATKLPAIGRAVLAACDAKDGVRDGVLNDPPHCAFDPAVLRCSNAETDACLTDPQIAALRKLYAGAADFPGLEPGAEEGGGGWDRWVLRGNDSDMSKFVNGFFRNMVFSDPGWTVGSKTTEENLRAARERMARNLDAIDPNLGPFQKHGGKLIMYHGWNDPAIPALNSADYYRSVAATMGQAQVDRFLRFYLVPGMQHCYGGPGACAFGQFPTLVAKDASASMIGQLERWVEDGAAPGSITATKHVEDNLGKPVVMTRPLCPYPQVAQYTGMGDVTRAESFRCGTARE